MTQHLWIVGSHDGAGAPADLAADCHRRLRGPYTGLGNLLRQVVPEMLRREPELVRRHIIAILSAAPELKELTGAGPETLTSLAAPTERTRIYPANRTRRLAHSALELLESYAATLRTAADSAPWTLLFHNVDEADHTDQEFLAIALRRARGGRLRLVVVTRGEQVIDELAVALAAHTERTSAPAHTFPADDRDAETLLRAYIDSDGTTAHPAEIAAYDAADPAHRATLHTARAVELLALGEQSLKMGAIPYHREHGEDPRGLGTGALYAAAEYGAAMGFYHAILDIGLRGRKIADPDTQLEKYWLLTTKACTALSMLGRSPESEPLYIELRSRYTDPVLHMYTGYALGMVYTRFHPTEQKDHHLARSYLNAAILIAAELPNLEDRAFHTVFMHNGRALIDMHLRDLPLALRTVNEGIERLHRELPADRYSLHQSVLMHNRGRVHGAMGDLAAALADFDTVIELDPQYPDYYLDRADVRRQLGDLDGALADCDHATTLTAPFYELHYNRADLRTQAGDVAGAIDDFGYVIELEPDQLDARVNLIGLLLEEGELDRAREHVDAGLLLHPGDARLTHARGLLAQEDGDNTAAMADFDAALAADPALVAALVSRATLAFGNGDHATAIADLSTALAADEDNADLLYNRGFVEQQAGHWADAVRDYTRALAQPDADRAELLQRRGACHAELGDPAARDADLVAAGATPGEVAMAG